VELSNKQRAIELVQAHGADASAALAFVSRDKFIQHDLEIADGLDSYAGWLEARAQSVTVSVVRVIEDGDFVVTHSYYDFGEPLVGFEIFRFEGGLAAEHWSNFQPVEKPNPSGHTLIDGWSNVADLNRTAANKALVREFVTEHLVNASDDIARFFDGDNYIQHNPRIPDGVSGLLKAGAEFRKQGLSIKFDKVHRILGEGNFVVAISEGRFGDDHLAFYDLYRVQDGKIAEHWDILQAVAPQGAAKNPHGKF
jgi:predicted SnoaL-like aldol condensation-catalyzing enzyme